MAASHASADLMAAHGVSAAPAFHHNALGMTFIIPEPMRLTGPITNRTLLSLSRTTVHRFTAAQPVGENFPNSPTQSFVSRYRLELGTCRGQQRPPRNHLQMFPHQPSGARLVI